MWRLATERTRPSWLAGYGSPRISSEMTLVLRTITDRTRAVRRQTQPAASRDRLRRVAQSAGGSPRPGSAPTGRDRPPRQRSGSTALRLPPIGHAAPRAHAIALSLPHRHCGSSASPMRSLFVACRIVCNDSECKAPVPQAGGTTGMVPTEQFYQRLGWRQ